MNVPGFKTATVSINYYKNTSLEKAIDRVFLEDVYKRQGRYHVRFQRLRLRPQWH